MATSPLGDGFDSTAFRDAIRQVYTMAATPVADDQVTFHFASQLVYNTNVDADNRPFDVNATVTSTTPDPVKVPCAVEYFDAENQPTNFGLMAPTKLRIALLDEDYAKVREAVFVTLGGDRYNYRRTEPPSGLFDVGIYTMHFTAENET